MAANRIIDIRGVDYELVPVNKKKRKKAEYSEEGMMVREKNQAIIRLIISRAKYLYYEMDYKNQIGWHQCVALASKQLKDEKVI